ncbi:transposase, partial [Streptomyces sp. NPDC086077]|uniref:transposase n=1 Tax=Streptomyces sp. NPDC086077 TaxID=3154862 RepID=UPI00341F02E1
APTSPELLFCHVYGRGRSADQFIPGWPYSFVVALETGRTSWTAVLDAIRLGPADDATAVTATQLREVVTRLVHAGQWQPGDADILVVMDTGYDVTRLAYVLADLPVELVGRLRSDRVMLRDAGPRRSTPRGGQPRKHGGVLTFSKPESWHTPDQATTCDTTRYGTAEAFAWDRMHPRLQARGPWLDHCGELPLIHGTLIRLKVEHLPGDRDPKPVWLWSSRTGMTGADVNLRWQAFLRRFDLEHTFRLFKQTLGWTVPKVRDPHTADLWTWLIIAAHTQLRLARPLAEDFRRPWERPTQPRRLTPARVRRGFRHLRVKTARPADVPRPAKPGPGRPPGSKNRRPAPRHEPGKTVKRIETLTEHVRLKQQRG